MLFPEGMVRGTLIQRYKRYLADVALSDGTVVIAHCPNPGALLGITPGMPVWLSPAPLGTTRKLAYSWELTEQDGVLVGINTLHPNKLVEEALIEKRIPELADYTAYRREVAYGVNSRIDFLLEAPGMPPCYLEVKNARFKLGPHAAFPDSITARGTKHQQELARMVAQGTRAMVLYVIQRGDCEVFRIAHEVDPAYAAAAREARAQGVETLAYQCHITPTEIRLEKAMLVQETP